MQAYNRPVTVRIMQVMLLLRLSEISGTGA